MNKHSNPARTTTTPCPRAGQTGGGDEGSPIAPAGLSPETLTWLRTVNRRCDQASLLLILIAVLWFGTASIGAALP